MRGRLLLERLPPVAGGRLGGTGPPRLQLRRGRWKPQIVRGRLDPPARPAGSN